MKNLFSAKSQKQRVSSSKARMMKLASFSAALHWNTAFVVQKKGEDKTKQSDSWNLITFHNIAPRNRELTIYRQVRTELFLCSRFLPGKNFVFQVRDTNLSPYSSTQGCVIYMLINTIHCITLVTLLWNRIPILYMLPFFGFGFIRQAVPSAWDLQQHLYQGHVRKHRVLLSVVFCVDLMTWRLSAWIRPHSLWAEERCYPASAAEHKRPKRLFGFWVTQGNGPALPAAKVRNSDWISLAGPFASVKGMVRVGFAEVKRNSTKEARYVSEDLSLHLESVSSLLVCSG